MRALIMDVDIEAGQPTTHMATASVFQNTALQPTTPAAHCKSIAQKAGSHLLRLVGCATAVTLALMANKNLGQRPSSLIKPELLPRPIGKIGEMSGVIIHNAGSDTKRSDTSFLFSSQHKPTVDMLEDYPIIGAQFDPYPHSGEWVLRHIQSDGSRPLPLVDELSAINYWLDHNENRIFVLDLDMTGVTATTEPSLREVINEYLGTKVATIGDCLTSQLCLTDANSIDDFLAAGKPVVMTKRTVDALFSDEGTFDKTRPLFAFEPKHAKQNYLDPLYRLSLGLPVADAYAFTSDIDDKGDLINTGSLENTLHAQTNTVLVLDHISKATFLPPSHFESEPTAGFFYTDDTTAQKVILGVTTMLASLAIIQSAMSLRQSKTKQEQAAAISHWAQGFQTLATAFPGSQGALAAAGLAPAAMSALIGIFKLLKQKGEATPAAAFNSPAQAREVDQKRRTQLVNHTLGALNSVSQFTSLAKQPISPVFKGLALVNVSLKGIAWLSSNYIHERAETPSTIRSSEKIQRMFLTLPLAFSLSAASLAFPRYPGILQVAAAASLPLPVLRNILSTTCQR